MWKYPWKFAEGIVICIGLAVTGAFLQFSVGAIALENLSYPINILFGCIYIVALLLCYFLGRNNKYILWFSKYEAAVTSLGALLLMVIIMGFTKQIPALPINDAHHHIHRHWWDLGFSQMTRSWIFVMLFIYFLSVLGLVTIRRIVAFRWRDFTFALNHLGLFIALFAGVLGSADLERLRMQTHLEQIEWRATTDDGTLVELPIAIELKSFFIEEFPPKLMMIDNEEGKVQPQGRPESILVENDSVGGKLLDWNVQVTRYLPMAAAVFTKDSANYVNFETHGATVAVYAIASKGDIRKEGWISSGNYMFPHSALTVDSLHSIVMPEREPKKYTSDVVVYTQSGLQEQTTIEVNKPYKIEGWKIYQLSYDEVMGRWSNTSIFELVKDPWLPYVYIGIFMMILGALGLFIFAKRN